MQTVVTQLIHQITGGQSYVFTLMPFGSRWSLFERVKAIVQREAQLSCIRADDIPGAGCDLLEKIHVAIERSELVIAEISERNPNVFYEIGYAVGIQKPVLLLAQRGVDPPSDLRGKELIIYGEDRHGLEIFDRDLSLHLRQRLNSQIAILRDMLVAERPEPSFIVAGPKYPVPDGRVRDQFRDVRTFGDNLGILGLISAYGSIFREYNGLELISAQYYSLDLPERDVNLFFIGSTRVNPLVEDFLKRIQSGSSTYWKFAPASGDIPEGRSPMSLFRVDSETTREISGRREPCQGGEVVVEDYGLIVRAPHPRHLGRLVMILAGAHSLGTGAACLAATRSALIRNIKLKAIDIANGRQAFWVLVKGKASGQDGLLDIDGVSIVDAGTFSKTSEARAASPEL